MNFSRTLEIVNIDHSLARKVIEYRKSKKKKVKLPDAIILASASFTSSDLITDDWDDFIGIDPKVEIVKMDKYKTKA